MRALCWQGVNDLATTSVPEPVIEHPRDVIVKVALSSVCGSDLHYIHGILPTMKEGDILGHEFVGEVVAAGAAVTHLRPGTRVVVPSIISCGECGYCRQGQWALCDRSNPNPELQEPMLGYPTCAFYGCSHMYGGFPGSHAEFIRVPFGDIGCFPIPDGVTYDQALFISDAAPTAYLGAELCAIEPGDTVAVWGCGAVGLLTQQFARMMGAERVIAIDRVPERLAIARDRLGSETIDFSEEDVFDTIKEKTQGHGPQRCIDAVGLEAEGTGISGAYDKVKQALHLETDRGEALRQALKACRKGGTLSILGVYLVMDKFPVGLMVNKSLTVRAALQNGHQHIPRLLELTQSGEFDASYLATHRYSLEDGARAYDVFKKKEDGCVRAVFAP
jgi:threonine dehydrogenase-like Zn-dependent dehydrogenase